MKKILIAFTLAVISISNLGGSEGKNEGHKVFLELYSKIYKKLPDSFSGTIKGKKIDEKLKRIPKDSYLNKNEQIFLRMSFSKDNGLEFVVVNVDELYRDLFKNIPKQIFALDLLFSKPGDFLLDKYNVKINYESEQHIILELSIKGSENKVLLYGDKNTENILRVDYLTGNKLVSTTIVLYKKISNYEIPYKFITKEITEKGSTTPEIFEIDNIQIK